MDFKKHPAAIARDEWMKTEPFKESSNPESLGADKSQRQYLENRLTSAFSDGWTACEIHFRKNMDKEDEQA